MIIFRKPLHHGKRCRSCDNYTPNSQESTPRFPHKIQIYCNTVKIELKGISLHFAIQLNHYQIPSRTVIGILQLHVFINHEVKTFRTISVLKVKLLVRLYWLQVKESTPPKESSSDTNTREAQ